MAKPPFASALLSVLLTGSWVKPNLGPATTINLLDEPGRPEDVHFGSIKYRRGG